MVDPLVLASLLHWILVLCPRKVMKDGGKRILLSLLEPRIHLEPSRSTDCNGISIAKDLKGVERYTVMQNIGSNRSAFQVASTMVGYFSPFDFIVLQAYRYSTNLAGKTAIALRLDDPRINSQLEWSKMVPRLIDTQIPWRMHLLSLSSEAIRFAAPDCSSSDLFETTIYHVDPHRDVTIEPTSDWYTSPDQDKSYKGLKRVTFFISNGLWGAYRHACLLTIMDAFCDVEFRQAIADFAYHLLRPYPPSRKRWSPYQSLEDTNGPIMAGHPLFRCIYPYWIEDYLTKVIAGKSAVHIEQTFGWPLWCREHDRTEWHMFKVVDVLCIAVNGSAMYIPEWVAKATPLPTAVAAKLDQTLLGSSADQGIPVQSASQPCVLEPPPKGTTTPSSSNIVPSLEAFDLREAAPVDYVPSHHAIDAHQAYHLDLYRARQRDYEVRGQSYDRSHTCDHGAACNLGSRGGDRVKSAPQPSPSGSDRKSESQTRILLSECSQWS